ncbi:hypothetical protein GGQ22_06110 [Nocardioides sp. zg-579]|uniref:Uncharacterized protein n=1 Tax=Nocardioides marmotae TaxID=2663857 RepID=A0A6I3J0X7_9ACTN|nr:hypothetical protein [Nocardioides marmotae]MCR6031014.1 hypothetical protein [Gordonia jinghuaiqii]MTB94651.1 hypothetical protein [Nocardioides marmotae]QKE01343.1 hypothetical protein HPC71_09875 [Nocardioides marmotae]
MTALLTRPTTGVVPGARRPTHPVAAATLVASLALLVQVLGYAAGWAGHETTAVVAWYVGFVGLTAPYAAALLGDRLDAAQRLTASVVYALVLYLSWFLTSPLLATRFDETLHVTTLTALAGGAGLFSENSMLPVSPHYPGLELAAVAVHWLSGLPLIACQVVVVALARVTLVVALFLLAATVTRSARVAGVVVLLYTASAQFYFFNAQFSYQTVAIAMLAAALLFLARACEAAETRPWRPMLAAQVCLAALAVTHHLTSWLTLGALWLLALLFGLGGERRRARRMLVAAEIATVVAAAWAAVVAPLLVRYLSPIFDNAGSELARLLALDGGGRAVGADGGGTPAPAWEVGVMAGSMVLWCLLLVPAAHVVWRGQGLGRSRARWLPLGLAAAYPILLVARFSPAAAEVADRASTFVTMAMALVVAVWLVPRLREVGRLAVPGVVLLVLGGTMLGSGPDWQRVPGDHLPGAEQRSVDATTVEVAQWAGRHLPAGSRIATDTTLGRVLPNFAPVEPVTSSPGTGPAVNVTELFLAREIDDRWLAIIEDGAVDFVAVDTRMTGQRVRSGSWFEGSQGWGERAAVLDAEQLGKFADVPGVDLVLDGPVRVYDVRALNAERRVFADRPDPGLPGDAHPGRTALAGLALLAVALLGRSRLRALAATPTTLLVSLPALMALGAVGVLVGVDPVVGALLLAGLAGAVALLPAPPAPPAAPVGPVAPARTLGTAGAVAVAVLLVCVGVAGLGQWRAQLDAPALPAPQTSAPPPTGPSAAGVDR